MKEKSVEKIEIEKLAENDLELRALEIWRKLDFSLKLLISKTCIKTC